jgi:hypothetical protein
MNISRLIQDVAAENAGENKDTIAQRVLDRIDPDDYQSALHKLLLSQVAVELSRHRSATLTTARAMPEKDWTSDGPQREPRAMAKIRAVMNALVKVENGTYVRTGNMTAADCRYVARVRFEHADATRAQGRAYAYLADTLDSTGAVHLDDLDSHMVADALDGKIPATT